MLALICGLIDLGLHSNSTLGRLGLLGLGHSSLALRCHLGIDHLLPQQACAQQGVQLAGAVFGVVHHQAQRLALAQQGLPVRKPVIGLGAAQPGHGPTFLGQVLAGGQRQTGFAAAARAGRLVTFGITPDSPETGYGYIQGGDEFGDGGARTIARFVEKPDLATAQVYLDDGSYYWNSGLFMMRASVWLATIEICRGDILAACVEAWERGSIDGEFLRVDKDAFAQCPKDSIDYAVMERLASSKDTLPPGVVIPLSAGWSDVGAWDALWEVLPKNEDGNVIQGDVVMVGSHNTLAISEGRLLACLGVDEIGRAHV